MRCNIDLRQSYGYGGISNYVRNISSRIVNGIGKEFLGCTFWGRNNKLKNFYWFPGKIHKCFIPQKFVYSDKIFLPFSYERLMGAKSDYNVFFSYKLPHVRFDAPVISTIHDIILLKTNCENKETIESHLKILEDTVKRSSYLLTVSEASKKDLIEYFGIDSNKIYIVHNGINQNSFDCVFSKQDRIKIKQRYNLPDNFILNFGGYRKHKNIERLLEAYALLPRDVRKELKLVLTRSHIVLDELINKLGIKEDVIKIGFVLEEDKVAIYKSASIVYYASLYEGFGVPVIESQAAGVPVITSNTSSLPEAAGGGAFLVDPYNTTEISTAIFSLYENKSLRKNLIEKGKVNSRQYTWEKSVEEFYKFIDILG